MNKTLLTIIGLCVLWVSTHAQAQTSCPSDGLVPRTSLSIASFDSQETVGENAPATNAIDGNPSTYWHTAWASASPPPPHQITINLGASYTVSNLTYLPRQDTYLNGTIGQFEIYLSQDNVSFGSPVATGTWPYTRAAKTAQWSGQTAKYVRLREITEGGGGPWASAAEISIGCVNQAPTMQTIYLVWSGQGPGTTYNLYQSSDLTNWTPLKTGLTTPFTQVDVPTSVPVFIRVTSVKNNQESPMPNAGAYINGQVGAGIAVGVN
jgi:F5/8 type C domain